MFKKPKYLVSIVRKGILQSISFDDLQNLVNADSSLLLIGKNFVKWDHPQQAHVYFELSSGNLRIPFPDAVTLEKMTSMARDLNAVLNGVEECRALAESEDWHKVLKAEFELEDNSFMALLRPTFTWDKNAFLRFTKAMYFAAYKTRSEKQISRNLAEGFWYASVFIKEWTSHPNFPRKHSGTYYEQSYKTISDLCGYLFKGHPPYMDDTLEKIIFTDK